MEGPEDGTFSWEYAPNAANEEETSNEFSASDDTLGSDTASDKRICVTAYHASQKPLTVTAAYGAYTATAEIWLVT